ncbi:MAG TPA: hypothetical protein VFJ71_10710 [Candidatus Limnocylindrales bacterium]|nr:hypothetical protein [Candidatus Limnocylindrales bacterium]
MLSATTRVVVAVVAVLVLLGGMAMLTIGPAGISGLWLVISAAVVLVALAIERNRYRSEEAERSFEATGPGGGEPAGGLEPRFRRTAETFVDPTTGATMRVFLDGRTGERRYVAEG